LNENFEEEDDNILLKNCNAHLKLLPKTHKLCLLGKIDDLVFNEIVNFKSTVNTNLHSTLFLERPHYPVVSLNTYMIANNLNIWQPLGSEIEQPLSL
jgi:hypothetical protein